jgi:hypothetical protein
MTINGGVGEIKKLGNVVLYICTDEYYMALQIFSKNNMSACIRTG